MIVIVLSFGAGAVERVELKGKDGVLSWDINDQVMIRLFPSCQTEKSSY